jgi:hypothetical protein
MKNEPRLALAIAALAAGFVTGSPALAQIPNCLDCVLGLYDNEARTLVMGNSTPGVVKTIYLGIDYAPPETELQGLEFSIHGMRSDTDGILILEQDWLVPPAIILGSSISAPNDTIMGSMATGGLTIGWQNCLTGSRTLLRLSFVHFAPAVNRVFKVMHKFPPSNANYFRLPVIVRCDEPNFTSVRIGTHSRPCYILNWDGDPDALACVDGPVAVEPRAWSSVKALFR